VPKLTASKLLEKPTRWLVAPVAVLALGISGLFGGLRPAGTPGADTAAAGTTIAGEPWNATVISARLARSSEDLPTKNSADHWIVVRIGLLVTGDEPITVSDTVRLRGASAVLDPTPAHSVLLRDGSDVLSLNPGLPETFDFYWEQAPRAAAPSTVVIDVYNETQRPNSFTGQLIWADPTVRAIVTVPVKAAP
jgi:hypothetical protein